MKILILNGHGIRLSVNNSKVHLKDGRWNTTDTPEEYVYSPRNIELDHVILYGHNGEITLDAIKFLIKHDVQISVLSWDGKLLTTMLPNQSVQIDAKFSQYIAYRDNKLRVFLAKCFIKAKFSRTQAVLDYLHSRYPVIRTDFSKEETMLENARSIPEIMMVEGRVASFYWQEWVKIIPADLEFDTREHQKKPRGAGDVVNCLLNYGYSILEAECLRAINSSGLDCHIGFMHEKCNGKNSLAYDMQEPFRFLVDLAVISLIENKLMNKTDFIRTETYTLRLRPSGAKKLIAALDKQFNERAEHKGATWSWRYIIQDKVTELSHYLQGKRKKIEFITPEWKTERQDKADIREIIKNISYKKWAELGFSKGTLHETKCKRKQTIQNICKVLEKLQ